jgi:hypothetical protein
MIATPARRTYTSLDAACDYFNRKRFAAQLPLCLITMQRYKGAYGDFSGARFASLDDPKEVTDEICLGIANGPEPTLGGERRFRYARSAQNDALLLPALVVSEGPPPIPGEKATLPSDRSAVNSSRRLPCVWASNRGTRGVCFCEALH